MMSTYQDILNNFQQLLHMDKATWFALGYACYLYILMDGATKTSARKNSYRHFYRHYR